jgi:methylmalonyl-CoA/ethylmalonyl-CoA epimerase
VLQQLNHIGFAVLDIAPAIAIFRDLLGASVGEIFEDPLQRVRLCFVDHVAGRIELIAPLGEHSPVDRIVAEGGGAYHLCYETDDLDADLARLRTHGFLPTAQPQPAIAFEGRRVVFLFHPIARLIELVEAARPPSYGEPESHRQ